MISSVLHGVLSTATRLICNTEHRGPVMQKLYVYRYYLDTACGETERVLWRGAETFSSRSLRAIRVGPEVNDMIRCEHWPSTYHAFAPPRRVCCSLHTVPLWPSECHRPSGVDQLPSRQMFGRNADTLVALKNHSEALLKCCE